MSELTLTLIRLGLLVLLWILVFSIVGVLRSDLYGTRVSRRTRQAGAPARRPRADGTGAAPAQAAAAAARSSRPGRKGPRAPTSVTVTQGQLAGTSLPLKQSGLLIGRNPECTLVLDDDFASGRHARLFPRPEGWFVEDLGSTNGTYLNNTKLAGTQPVGVGSVVRIGKTVLELRG